ncbi:serine/threonine-protein kinase [Paraliomyxa miuraensis]|uniref:serine/threonine-protein kinase n=1 Tax=Paraliomyxa miuraensis TaxID=376150 RepID=UPI0022550CA4|nr:serine/threonine-protein kinase [Paraliomyxa miuraensis]MCX4240885.1 serine/threonine-protein kinase [Paraliomyxa miuraensis]
MATSDPPFPDDDHLRAAEAGGGTTTLGPGHARVVPSAEVTLAGVDGEGRPSLELTITGDDSALHEPTRPLDAGAAIGRYVVLQRLGAGGMGVVYAAYDPELDRKIALKLLLPGTGGPVARARLLREAQALAKLSHPNVVALYDVGTVGEQVWLAMEFVQGKTLGAWLGTPRRWTEVLAMVRSAGEGLAAAHAAGLMHRDFKPDNVMVGDDGRVRVMDFGLARLHASAMSYDPDEVPTSSMRETSALLSVTRVGAIVGTPGYMAPEQLGRGELTATADQFAFCVTLWEALYGERPIEGDTWMEISDHLLSGRIRTPPTGREVPRWLRHACERGLAVEPAQRWPSMRALLDTLATGRTRARTRQGLIAVGALAVMGIGAEATRRYDLAERAAACEAAGSEIETAFGPARAQELRAALVGTGVSHAATTASKTLPWLERQATAWREARVEACLDAEVRGRWDVATLDRSLWCLDERRMELESLVDELTLADADVLQKAVTAAAGLAAIAPCRDERALGLLAPPPDASREGVRAVRAKVTRASNLERAGRYDKGLVLVREALSEAEALQWRPLVATAQQRLGSLLEKSGAFAEAEAMLADAYFQAAEVQATELAFESASLLVLVVGNRSARHPEGRHWARLAELALTGLGEDEGLRRAELLLYLALIDDATGASAAARERGERALAIRERLLGPNHPAVAASLKNLANVHLNAGTYGQAEQLSARALAIYEQELGPEHPAVAFALLELARVHSSNGAYAKALPLLERSLAIVEPALGPEHPHVGAVLNNIARTHTALGRYDEATQLQQRALAIFERSQGPQHPNVASSLTDLAQAHMAVGAHDRAGPLHERALAIFEKAYGPVHADVARSLAYLAAVELASGRYERAVPLYERSIDVFEQSLGPDSPDLATCLGHLGNAHMTAGAHDRAAPLYERSLAILERTLGPAHPLVAHPLVALAQVELAQGRVAAAVPLLERAVVLAELGELGPHLAGAQLLLAGALWDAPVDQGRDRTRAVALATQAHAGLRVLGESATEEITAVEAWLREHAEAP